MNVGINLIGFLPGKIGGMETYARNLISQLQRVDQTDNITLLCDEWNLGEFPVASPNFSHKVCNYSKPSLRRFVRSALRKTIGVDILRAEPRYQRFDVIHHPFTIMRPEWHGTKSVLTFWDMQHEFYPEFFSSQELQRKKETYKPSVEAARRVIVSANFTKECLIERYGIPPEKIDVVYTGYGPEYKVINDLTSLQAERSQLGLDRQFIYYPAATWHTRTIRTFCLPCTY